MVFSAGSSALLHLCVSFIVDLDGFSATGVGSWSLLSETCGFGFHVLRIVVS